MKIKFGKLVNSNYLIKELLFPILTLTVYCLTFSLIYKEFLPEGVNYSFFNQLWKLLLILLGIIIVILIVLMLSKRYKKITFNENDEKDSLSEMVLLLFPLTPLIQYIINNDEILSSSDIILMIGSVLILSIVLILGIPNLLRRVSSSRTIKMVGLSFLLTVLSMAMLSAYFNWYEKGNFIIQFAFLTGTFFISYFLFTKKRKSILYTLIIGNLIITIVTQSINAGIDTSNKSSDVNENQLLQLTSGKELKNNPNIYLLIYDAYVNNETMLSYGIDNSTQEQYLKTQGFVLYPHTYSVGADSLSSMSRVLDASEDYSGGDRRAVSGDGIVQNILSSYGYHTYGIFSSDYFFRGIGSNYDDSIYDLTKNSSFNVLSSAIIMGEFKFDIGFESITYAQFLEVKRKIIKNTNKAPFFLYSHAPVPGHSQNSGNCLPDEKELYEARLDDANEQMQADIDLIIKKDPEAIVIIAGDHGPYLTKNCVETGDEYDISEITRLDIQDRFGVLLAIRWPSEDYTKYDEIVVLQDIFPAIFAYMFKDESILDSKIDPEILNPFRISGATVIDGIIYGGVNDGELLFLSGE